MKRLLGAVLATFLMVNLGSPVRADDKDPQAVLDKAIKALGGEEKLKKAESITLASKGTITFGGNDNDFKSHVTIQGLDHIRSEVRRGIQRRTPQVRAGPQWRQGLAQVRG